MTSVIFVPMKPDSALKSDLRREAELRRRALANPDHAGALARHVTALNLMQGAVVAGYAAFRDEADPKPLLLALANHGHPLALPAIVASGAPLRFHRWREGDAMRLHAYGVSEPLAEAAVVVPSVVLVPLLAFDATGWRLGYGGGYYDRTLAAVRSAGAVRAIGIAYGGQEIAAVPHSGHDQRLDAVLTEAGLRRFAV
jgi:5-formyltetrahydrofolate cyclo-ligase